MGEGALLCPVKHPSLSDTWGVTSKHKHKKHRQFPNVATGRPSYIVAGGVVVPAWPSYMYMSGLGDVTGAGFPPAGHDNDGSAPASGDGSAGAAPTSGDGGTGSAAASQ